MYKKQKKSWVKHLDFLILDLLCLEVTFYLSCVIRLGNLHNDPGMSEYYNRLAIVLLLIFRANMPLSVLFLALTSACSHSVNFLLICLVPKRFEKFGRFSLVTGLINSCTYIGAAISTYGFAEVSESYGWNVTLVLWGGNCADRICMLLCGAEKRI